MTRRTSLIAGGMFALTLLLTLFAAKPAAAQSARCFPETNQCISGAIRTYWEKNGGLSIFGFPITEQRTETVEGRTLQVQWFERDRLEIQADGIVTAGRLGVELLEKQGRPWQLGNQLTPDPGCLGPFPTGYQICGTFAKYWQNNGGLIRLGYPVTGQIQETIEGQGYTVQYFERRRFELHGTQVLLGLLGREVLYFAPPDPCTQIPASSNAYVEPNCAPAGTVFGAIAMGFIPGEQVGVYVTAPDQSVIGASFQLGTDSEGFSEIAIFSSNSTSTPGIYAFSFEGVTSHRKGIAYFRIK